MPTEPSSFSPDAPLSVPPSTIPAIPPPLPVAGQARTGFGARNRPINLIKLAEAQRGLIWCVLVRLVIEIGAIGFRAGFINTGQIPPHFFLTAYGVLVLASSIAAVVLAVRTARAYGHHWAWAVFGGLLTLLGCIGLLVLLLLNQRVTATLKRAGVKVGFMGVSKADMNKLRLGVCTGCGYPIAGLTGGLCPECGKPLPTTFA